MQDKLTISELIILFKHNLNQLIVDSGLSVDIIWYIMEDKTSEIKDLYQDYSKGLIVELNNKLRPLEHQETKDVIINPIGGITAKNEDNH